MEDHNLHDEAEAEKKLREYTQGHFNSAGPEKIIN